MRPISLLLLLLPLMACAGDRGSRLSDRPPGLDVADVALNNGAPEAALHIAQGLIARDAHNVAALIQSGQAEVQLGQREAAVRSFRKALAVAPDNGSAALALGRLELITDPNEAAAVLAPLTKREPRNVAALTDLGIARDLLGQHGEAQRLYRIALSVEPDRLAANVNLGLSLALSGNSQEALAILRPLAAVADATPRIRQDLAAALTIAGQIDEATALLQATVPPQQVLAMIAGYRSLGSTQ